MDEYANDGLPSGLLLPPAEPKCVCLLIMSTGVKAVSDSSARGEVSANNQYWVFVWELRLDGSKGVPISSAT